MIRKIIIGMTTTIIVFTGLMISGIRFEMTIGRQQPVNAASDIPDALELISKSKPTSMSYIWIYRDKYSNASVYVVEDRHGNMTIAVGEQ